MRTNTDYILKEIAGESLLIPTGEASQRLNGMIRLTETAAFIWKQVDDAENLEEIVRRMTDEFEVDQESAKKDVYGFLNELFIRDMVFDIPELPLKEQE